MIAIRPYGARFFAVYEDDVLLAVCCYRRGAVAIRERIEALRRQVEHLEQVCEAAMAYAPSLMSCESR